MPFQYGLFEMIILASSALTVSVLPLVCFWMIFRKAGFPPWYAFGILLPVLNLVLLFYLALSTWPNLRDDPDAGL